MTFDELMRHGWCKPALTEPEKETPFWAKPAFPMAPKVRAKIEAKYPEAAKQLPPFTFDEQQQRRNELKRAADAAIKPIIERAAIRAEIEKQINTSTTLNTWPSKPIAKEPYWTNATFPKCINETGSFKLAKCKLEKARKKHEHSVTKRTHLRIYLLSTTDYQCFYCEKPLTDKTITIDHFIPQSKGGGNKKLNLRPACSPCNGKKGDLMPSEFYEKYPEATKTRWYRYTSVNNAVAPTLPVNKKGTIKRLNSSTLKAMRLAGVKL